MFDFSAKLMAACQPNRASTTACQPPHSVNRLTGCVVNRGEPFASDGVIHHPVRWVSAFSENRSKSARVRAICDRAWTRRASTAALILRIRRNLSEREISRSIGGAGGIGRIYPAKAACGHPYDLSFAKDAKNRFQHRGDRAMSVHDGRGTKPLPEKEISIEH